QITDIFGALKNVAVTVEELRQALAGHLACDSSVLEGLVDHREQDVFFRPDPATFAILPWRPRDGAVARLICEAVTAEGAPYPGCSRGILRRLLDTRPGWQLLVGVELQFFLFHTDGQGNPTTVAHDRAGYCDLTPMDLGENARRDMVLTLEQMGIEVASSHHEAAPGQHAIALKDDHPLAMADKVVTSKFVIRTIAQRHGLHASFMPHPLPDVGGSAMTLALSLWRNGHNLLCDASDPLGLSTTAYHFVGGILRHARALTALTNPLVNSYKRFAPAPALPVLVGWSEHNRNTVLRLSSRRGPATRLVLRTPDPSCNPYLVLAALLSAGLDGIDNAVQPPPPLEGYEDGRPLRQLVGEMGVPRHLPAALEALAADPVIAGALGAHVMRRFIEAKEREWEQFHSRVHPWELEQYLSAF
ncbi:MAG: glutamine synthetase, partial [Firmicutes bacterium]|nr:glutamine synthetase [Bacillota bacterium]